ncbi:MAG: DUF2029 domain-containing protein, partial [Actinomycetia bacterium]|nr:DUF2029 domain-containing protein [Actinomycetes bacterium]
LMIQSIRSLEKSTLTRTIFWLAVVVMGIVSAQHVVSLVNAVSDGNGARVGLDYRAFLAAGELIRSGNSHLLYEPTSVEFLALAQVGFVYPPWAALFMVPWTFLPVGVGLVVWTAVGLGAAVSGLYACGVRDWRPATLALVSFPSVFALGLGQSTFLFVGVVGFSVASMMKARSTRSGVWLALAGWKPHLLGGFALLWIADPRRWTSQIMAAASTTALLVVASAIALPGSWSSWLAFLFDSVNELASAVLEASLPGMVSLLIGSLSPIRWLISGVLAIGIVIGVVTALRRRRSSIEASLALAMGAWLLIVPHVVVYDVLILVIPLSIAFHTHLRRDVVISGTMLAFGLSIGPRVTQMQLDRFGRAIDPSTLALIGAVSLFAYWVWAGDRFFHSDEPTHDSMAAGRHRSDVS